MRQSASAVTATIAAVAFMLASCAGISPGGAPGPIAQAPTFRVGDHWVYHATDGYRVPIIWDETHEVTHAGPDGITVRVTLKGSTVDFQRTETWATPGIVRTGAVYEAETDRFDPPLVRYQYPLSNGQSWRQEVRNLDKAPDPYGPIQYAVTVGGYESVATPAGTFDAIRMRILMQLDDGTFWRYPTQCDYLVWYAPSLGIMVKEQKRSYYVERGYNDSASVPGQFAMYELASFTRGP